MIRGLLRAAGLAAKADRPKVVASYDLARTTDRNKRVMAGARDLSADAAASAEERRVLRNRARYVTANSSYARGMIETKACDVIGTGPRLQMTARDVDSGDSRRVEREFARWSHAVNLPAKLRLAVRTLVESGEMFAIMATNPGIRHAVKLDLRLIEADQVANPYETPLILATGEVDGIEYDAWGNPTKYRVLKDHPGSDTIKGRSLEADDVSADKMIHLYRQDRPGQSRGVPWITPAVDRLLNLDGFTLATLDAARTAASLGGVVKSDHSPADDADYTEPDERDIVEIGPNEWMTLPAGWSISQFKAEHPTTTYPQFKAEIIKEIGRCLSMPYNVAGGDSSSYNYASGRLDHQPYHRAVSIVQSMIEREVLDRIFERWLSIATLMTGLIPQSYRGMNANTDHVWFWDGFRHVDPLKEANAEVAQLEAGTLTLADVFARKGEDWEAKLEQRARESEKLEDLGLPPVGAQTSFLITETQEQEEDDDE